MNDIIKVGLAGFGISAKVFHAPFLKLSPHYTVTTILERHNEASKAFFPSADIVRTFEALLQKDVDLVVITTPNDTHFTYALQALQAGKHVIVEKPFTIHSSEAAELIHIAKQKKLVLTVYHNRRYVSDYLTIQKIVQQSLLGKIHTFEAHYNRYRAEERPNAWREKPLPGSGILYDLGAHLIDQALSLFGLPKFITADVSLQRPHAKAIDWFDVRLDYGFLQTRLSAGMLVREPGPRYIIHGINGSFIKTGEDPQEAKLRAGEMPVINFGKEPESMYGLLHTVIDGKTIREKVISEQGDYGLFYEDVYHTLFENTPLKIKPEEAFNVIKLIELAEESSLKKCTVTCEGLMMDA